MAVPKGSTGATSKDMAIEVEDLVKTYRIYHERNHSLKSTVLSGRRARYEEFNAVDGVSFTAPHGRTLGLIGQNGSGKSTLLKCIARILKPNAGKVAVNGRMSALLELGAGFHPELSGRENVFLNGAILGLRHKEIVERFDSIVEFAGLERFIDNPVKNYSSGMYVRLGFSVAIHVEPEIFLVDEVLAVGDQDFQQRCQWKFADLKANGCTIVLVTHSMDNVERMCDDAIWMHKGQVRNSGPAHDVVTAYLDYVNGNRSELIRDQSTRKAVDGVTVRPTIESVDLIDADGNSATSFRTASEMTIRFAYRARDLNVTVKPMIRISRADGVWVSNINTPGTVPYIHDELVYVEYRIPALPLLPGQYEIGVELWDDLMLSPFVAVERSARFDVFGHGDLNESGIVRMDGEWQSGVLEAMPPSGT